MTTRLREILEKNASFGLKKFPISIWNYTNLAEHGQHMTEAEMDSLADAGITVPHAPSFDPAVVQLGLERPAVRRPRLCRRRRGRG